MFFGPSANTEGEGCMSSTAVGHQGAEQMFWPPFWLLVPPLCFKTDSFHVKVLVPRVDR